MYIKTDNGHIYIDIQPIDSWDEWVYNIYTNDMSAPIIKIYESNINHPFKTYYMALSDAISYLTINKII